MVNAAGFGEGGEVSVVLDEGREFEIFLEFVGDIEGLPGEIAEPGGAVVLHDARHSDAEGDDFTHDEIDTDLLEEQVVESVLINRGLEFDGVENLAACADEGNDSLGTTNINTEIHTSIIPHSAP